MKRFLALLLVTWLLTAPAAVRAESAKDTLKDCIASPERYLVTECDTAYGRWKTVRADRFKKEAPAPVVEAAALAIPETEKMGEAAITWFGAIDAEHNYADVRIAHSGPALIVAVSVIDPWLSRDDAVELTVGGLTQRVGLSLDTPWRGSGFDDGLEDRGWIANFRIPNAPANATLPLTVTLHDERKAPQTYRVMIRTAPEPFTAATGAPSTVELPVLRDASVGGGGNCSGDLADSEFFARFGSLDRTNEPQFNVQNELDISDWPCFSKYYALFPSIEGRVVKVDLVLHQFGNAGGPDWNPPAEPTLVQAATTDAWQGGPLTWNTAPQPRRIVGRSWIDLMRVPLEWPGVERVIDVSPAVVPGVQTALVLYTSDLNYHGGKYFVSKSTGDWNAAGRPKLRVTVAQ